MSNLQLISVIKYVSKKFVKVCILTNFPTRLWWKNWGRIKITNCLFSVSVLNPFLVPNALKRPVLLFRNCIIWNIGQSFKNAKYIWNKTVKIVVEQNFSNRMQLKNPGYVQITNGLFYDLFLIKFCCQTHSIESSCCLWTI